MAEGCLQWVQRCRRWGKEPEIGSGYGSRVDEVSWMCGCDDGAFRVQDRQGGGGLVSSVLSMSGDQQWVRGCVEDRGWGTFDCCKG